MKHPSFCPDGPNTTFVARAVLLSLALVGFAGCGTENPFDRGFVLEDALVTGPLETENVSFQQTVRTVLQSCVSCHAGGTGGWAYDGGAGAYSAARSVVDPGDPENSLLLIKATGGAGHGGGAIFSASSDRYQALLAWIAEGALNN